MYLVKFRVYPDKGGNLASWMVLGRTSTMTVAAEQTGGCGQIGGLQSLGSVAKCAAHLPQRWLTCKCDRFCPSSEGGARGISQSAPAAGECCI